MIVRLDSMAFKDVQWLFPLAVTLHNTEEVIWLPAWSQQQGRWRRPVGSGEFRFAVALVTGQVWLSTYASVKGGRESLGAYLMTGSAAMMLLNAVIPHTAATLLERRYAPGVGTGVMLNIPITTYILRRAILEGYVSGRRLTMAAAGISLATVMLLPRLFALGRHVVQVYR